MRKLKTVISETVRASVPALTITVMDNEARVLDTALAEQLGMARPTNIRTLIEANLEELESFGHVALAACSIAMPRGGSREGSAFYLNRQQALLVCILSKTEKAKAVRAEVIRRFDAYEELTRPAQAPVEPVFQVPQTFSEALRLAANLAEENEILKVENMALKDTGGYHLGEVVRGGMVRAPVPTSIVQSLRRKATG